MITAERRNKNFGKTKIEYDVNVYVREEYRDGESYWNTNNWYLHVYDYDNGQNPFEVSEPFLLTREEAFAMNFMETGDIDGGLDGWMSMEYLIENYRAQMSDRVLEYLERFPKYYEDIRIKQIY